MAKAAKRGRRRKARQQTGPTGRKKVKARLTDRQSDTVVEVGSKAYDVPVDKRPPWMRGKQA